MSYIIKNISGGQLVFPLKSSETLRLNNGEESKPIKEGDITPYIEHISSKGYVRLKKVDIPHKIQDKKEAKNKEKGEINNG